MPIVLLTLHTGLRQGEVFNLQVDDFDFDPKVPVLTVVGLDPKTGARSKSMQSRHIPLNRIARDTIKAWLTQTKYKGYVFPGGGWWAIG